MKEDYEHVRNGTCNIFVFTALRKGWHYVHANENRTRVDWALHIEELLDVYYPKVSRICLVMDKLNTHSIASLYDTFPPEKARRLAKCLEIYYTSKHGSWLNIAEIELNVMTLQCLGSKMHSNN